MGLTGKLQNSSFPSEVEATQKWTGHIDAVNVGDTRDRFRIRVRGEAGIPFHLDPGQSATEFIEGTGPEEFDVLLERGVGWLEDIKKWVRENPYIVAGSAAALGLMAIGASR